jgi:hypothetical protein
MKRRGWNTSLSMDIYTFFFSFWRTTSISSLLFLSWSRQLWTTCCCCCCLCVCVFLFFCATVGWAATTTTTTFCLVSVYVFPSNLDCLTNASDIEYTFASSFYSSTLTKKKFSEPLRQTSSLCVIVVVVTFLRLDQLMLFAALQFLLVDTPNKLSLN